MSATLLDMNPNNEVNDVLRAWEAWQRGQGLSENTITVRERVVRHFFDYTGSGPFTITSKQVIEFVGRRDLSASSRSTYHRYLSAYCKWLATTEQRLDDPTVKTPKPRQPRGVPRPVGNTEVPLIFEQCPRRRTKMMLYLATYQGLRVHEIAKFRGEHISVAEGLLVVVGKGNKEAVLPLHAEVAALSEQFPKKGFWFPSPSNDQRPIQPGTVTAAIGRACNRAGFDRTAHQLRHWYATALLESGVDIRYVQELMRHESLATTQIYTQVSKEKLRDAIKGLHIQITPVAFPPEEDEVA